MNKAIVLCLLLLPACWFPSDSYEPVTEDYALTWTCLSPEGCERTEEVNRIDRVRILTYDLYFTSTQDDSFLEEAQRVTSDTLGRLCFWMISVSFFGHELEQARMCHNPAGFEVQFSIPNQDPTTFSRWYVKGRDLSL